MKATKECLDFFLVILNKRALMICSAACSWNLNHIDFIKISQDILWCNLQQQIEDLVVYGKCCLVLQTTMFLKKSFVVLIILGRRREHIIFLVSASLGNFSNVWFCKRNLPVGNSFPKAMQIFFSPLF